jgi:hypothetical protein
VSELNILRNPGPRDQAWTRNQDAPRSRSAIPLGTEAGH